MADAKRKLRRAIHDIKNGFLEVRLPVLDIKNGYDNYKQADVYSVGRPSCFAERFADAVPHIVWNIPIIRTELPLKLPEMIHAFTVPDSD